MPSIHDSETPPLGWLVPCLAVSDLRATLDFYAHLDLVPYGGKPDEGWSMLRNRAAEIHVFEGHIPKDLLNFRGGDLPTLRDVLTERGFVVHQDLGKHSFIYLDPDGREVFFDSSPAETAEYESGQALTGGLLPSNVHEGDGLDLGNLTVCLACHDLAETASWYERLGWVPGGGNRARGWAILARRDHMPEFGTRLMTTSLSLFQDTIVADTINFRGGNVGAIAGRLEARGIDLRDGVQIGEDGGESLLVLDPDDRPVLLDTTPPERLY